jgi:3-dehydroquinate synthase
VFTPDALAPDDVALRDVLLRLEPTRRHRLLAVVERTVAEAHPTLVARLEAWARRHAAAVTLVTPPAVVRGGEAAKGDPAALDALRQLVHDHRIDRQSFVLVIGGGALLDLAGYAAATVHRGVRIVRMPTTVLAQADSGVSVKNGVNAFGQKNFLGTFAPPFAVVNDASLLATLPRREVIGGLAEAVKVALIRDAEFFAWQRTHVAALAAGDRDALAAAIRRCAELHLAHIAGSGDPFELGSARPLDFGHWAAHKLETLTEHRLRHGEAVAIGIALDACYSAAAGLVRDDVPAAVLDHLERLGFRLWDEALARLGRDERPLVLDGLAEFREHLGGELTVTLLAEVGRGIEVHEMREDLIQRALGELRARDAAR